MLVGVDNGNTVGFPGAAYGMPVPDRRRAGRRWRGETGVEWSSKNLFEREYMWSCIREVVGKVGTEALLTQPKFRYRNRYHTESYPP